MQSREGRNEKEMARGEGRKAGRRGAEEERNDGEGEEGGERKEWTGRAVGKGTEGFVITGPWKAPGLCSPFPRSENLVQRRQKGLPQKCGRSREAWFSASGSRCSRVQTTPEIWERV